jgi:hypothetical protein
MFRYNYGYNRGRSNLAAKLHPEALYSFDFTTNTYFGAAASDFVVTRASPGLAQDLLGNWVSFGNNVMRSTNRGLLIEEARTNSITHATGFLTGWTNGSGGDASVTQNAGTSPALDNTATLLDDNNATQTRGRSTSFSITSGATAYTGSIFIKAGTSSVASLRISLVGGTSIAAEAVINLLTGEAQWRSGASGTTLHPVVPCGGGWYRLAFTITDNSTGNNTLGFEVRPAFNSTYTNTPDAAATGTALFWGAQCEIGSFATSPIITAGSAVTRAADNVSLAIPSLSGTYSMLAIGTANAPNPYTAAQNFVQVDAGSGTNRWVIRRETNATYLSTLVGGTGAAFAPAGTWATGTRTKFAGAIEANSQASVVNGGTPGTATAATLPTSPTFLRFGVNSGGTEQFNGIIQGVAVVPRRLSNAELQAWSA